MAVTSWKSGNVEQSLDILLRHKAHSFEALLCLCAVGRWMVVLQVAVNVKSRNQIFIMLRDYTEACNQCISAV